MGELGFEFDPSSRRKRRHHIETKGVDDLLKTYRAVFNEWDETTDKGSKGRPDGWILFKFDEKLYILFKEWYLNKVQTDL